MSSKRRSIVTWVELLFADVNNKNHVKSVIMNLMNVKGLKHNYLANESTNEA